MNATRSCRLTLLLALFLAGCADAQPTGSTGLDGADVVLTDQPDEVALIGRTEGESWEMLSGVRAVAFDAQDNAYIIDGQASAVFVYDANGAFIRQIGRRGGGPGELQSPWNIVVLEDGDVVINDRGHAALIIFDNAGSYVRNISWRGLPGGVSGIHALGPRQLLLHGGSTSSDGTPEGTRVARAMILDLAEGEPRVITEFETTAILAFRVEAGGNTLTVMRTPEYAPGTFMGATPNGEILVQHESAYRVKVLDGSGAVVGTIERPIPPRLVGAAEKEAWQRRREEQHAATGAPGPPPPMAYEMPFADEMSVVTGFLADPAGRLWIQRRQADGGHEGAIDLVTTDRRYLGTLPPQPLPPPSPPPASPRGSCAMTSTSSAYPFAGCRRP
jgi:hypothetical protein